MFYNKRPLCFTSVADFTDFQGIGRDPLYIRFDSVWSVVQKYIDPAYHHFLAQPAYDEKEDYIVWHIEETSNHPKKLIDLPAEERVCYEQIKTQTIESYRQAANNMDGDELLLLAGVLRYLHDEFIFCADNKVYIVAWGMTPDTNKHQVLGECIRGYKTEKKISLTFNPGINGVLANPQEQSQQFKVGVVLDPAQWPQVVANEGWIFTGWMPQLAGQVINDDVDFSACYDQCHVEVEPEPEPFEPEPYEPEMATITFVTNECGTLEGINELQLQHGQLLETGIPQVKPRKGWKFLGWIPTADGAVQNIIGQTIYGNATYYARYEKKRPWWAGWRSCLIPLLSVLGFLLALLVLFFFLHTCVGCNTGIFGGVDNGDNGDNIVPIDSVNGRDDNGEFKPITGEDGELPADTTIATPITGEDGTPPPIAERPGMPDIIANRLLLFMEEDNGDIDALAKDFKQAYPGDKYSIVGVDRNIKLLAIQIPEAEREQIRKTISQKLSQHKLLVMDETLLSQPRVQERNGFASQKQTANNARSYVTSSTYNGRQNHYVSTSSTMQPVSYSVKLQSPDRQQPGWHLNAIHLQQGWKYTKGSSSVTVAIVDDGIQANHPMFKGRIVNAYNVFRQDNRLSVGEGHGTHVAGLAAGSADFYAKGAAGVAPQCKIMPIQVADNKIITTSTMAAGIMYAIHHGADVVNVSLGTNLSKISALPPAEQMEVARRLFRNEAYFWNRVCQIAAKKNTVLVFAAGNDAVLSVVDPKNRNNSSIVVSAVNRGLSQTSFTNYGPGSDISAPGENILSAFPMSAYKPLDGTSMAAPIVTGAVALMKSLKKDLTVAQVRYVLQSTGQKVRGNVPPMLLLDQALAAVKTGRVNPPAGNGNAPIAGGGNSDGSGGGYSDSPGGDYQSGGAADSRSGGSPSRGSAPGSDYGSGASQGGGFADNTGGISSGSDSPPTSGSNDDAEEIRRLIAEYKRKIADLESRLKRKK